MMEIPQEVIDLLKGKSVEEAALKVVYKNYKGEVENRKVVPISVYFGSTEYHPSEQWFMKVWDIDKNALRDYALNGIIKFGWD